MIKVRPKTGINLNKNHSLHKLECCIFSKNWLIGSKRLQSPDVDQGL